MKKTIKGLCCTAMTTLLLSACNLPPAPDFTENATTDKAMSDSMDKTMMQEFEVTLAVPADAPGPLAPGVFVVHREGMPLFRQNMQDRGQGLEAIAEDGNPMMAAEQIPGAMVFNTPVGDSEPGPATPGKSYRFMLTAQPGDHLSFATMYVQSNDAFYAPSDSGIPLFVGDTPISGDMTAKVMLWDSGTEVNQPPGEGADQAPRQSGPNTGASESEPIQLISARDNFTYGNNIQLTITPKK